MLVFKPGTNYYCDEFGGVVLYVSRRCCDFIFCQVLFLKGLNLNKNFNPLRADFKLCVKRSLISNCEFVTFNLLHNSLTILYFYASDACRPFVLADFRDNFVNYHPF